jgi:hypothetical protein
MSTTTAPTQATVADQPELDEVELAKMLAVGSFWERIDDPKRALKGILRGKPYVYHRNMTESSAFDPSGLHIRKKRKKNKNASGKPKLPTKYNIHMKVTMKELKEQNPDWTHKSVFKEAAKRWQVASGAAPAADQTLASVAKPDTAVAAVEEQAPVAPAPKKAPKSAKKTTKTSKSTA